MTAALATAVVPVAHARAAAICGTGTYAYAGIGSKEAVRGISATITATAPANVRDGHVAGWVGVSSADGETGWLQVGLSAFRGDLASRLYYEVTVPGQKTLYREVAVDVPFGQPHRFAVAELPKRDWWQASVDGVPVGTPVHLPGSDRRWRAQAVGESWAGATSGACNDYGYAFASLSFLGARATQWRSPAKIDLFQDPGYVLVRSSSASFVAASNASYSALRSSVNP